MSQIPLPPPGQPVISGSPNARMGRRNITFTPDGGAEVFLKVDGGWKFHVGIAPDINHGVVSYVEFLKFGGKPGTTGAIKLYSVDNDAANPDVVLVGVRLIAIEALDMRDTPADGIITVEYRLFFADFRDRWCEPRGGRLRNGVINVGVITPYDGTGQAPPAPTAPELSLSDLITECLNKMGLSGVAVPATAADAPRDIKWFGNHAPTELKKLLDLAHIAFVPGFDGSVTLQTITHDGTPTLPKGDASPVQTAPAIDRRGVGVVFSSYPRRVIRTVTESGPSEAWYFVAQNSIGVWTPIESCDLLVNAGGAAAAVKSNFANVAEKFRTRLAGQVYRCIQAAQTPTCAVSPVLNRMIEKDLQEHDILILAQIAQQDAQSGYWKNSLAPVSVKIVHRNDLDILVLDFPLVSVSGSTANPLAGFSGPANFTVRYSFEDADDNGDGTFTPRYFHVGFTANGVGGPVNQMSDDDVENAIDGGTKDTIILTRPQWRLVNVDDADANLSALTAKAQTEAAQWIADASKPAATYNARGFANVPLSGLVTEIEWDQADLRTTLKAADWYVPVGALANGQLRKLEADGPDGGGQPAAYPNQATTEATRLSKFESGATQPTLPLGTQTIPMPIPGARLVQMSGIFQGGGMYSGVYAYGTPQQIGADAFAGNNLLMPEGYTVDTADKKVILANLPESGQNTHLIPDQSWQMAFPLGTYQANANAAPVDVLALIAMGEVDIQILSATSTGKSGTYRIAIPNGGVRGEVSGSGKFQMPAKGQTIPNLGRIAVGQNLAENGLAAGAHMLEVDGSVWARGGCVGFDDSGFPLYHFRCDFSMDVTVYSDGGSDGLGDNRATGGSAPTRNTWTYTVFDRTGGIPIASGLTPLWAREFGPSYPGTHGRIRIGAAGAVILLDVDDVIQYGSC